MIRNIFLPISHLVVTLIDQGHRSHQGPLQAPVDASIIQATLPRQRRRSNNDLPVHPHSDHYHSQHRY